MDALSNWTADEILLEHSRTVVWLLHKLQAVLADGAVRATGLLALFYAAVLFTEGIGVYMQQHWAELLMIFATASLIPIELRHLWHRPGLVGALILLANCFIVWFLYRVLKRDKPYAHVARPRELVVGLGGTANMDGGRGLLDALGSLPCPTRVLCDVQTLLYDAPRLYGTQKGATPAQIAELEVELRADAALAPVAELPGSGAAGGLGAALASLGAELLPGAPALLDLVGFAPDGYDLVVTGEGTVDATTREGKAPAEVARRCGEAGVPCVLFGGRVTEAFPGVETVALSGEPARARDDLVALGLRLGACLLDAAG